MREKGVFESRGEKETLELAKKMGSEALPGQIICLEGDLGVGKTVFAKGLALGLGLSEPVSSPTFTIVKTYEGGRLPLYHFDVYRIEEPEEMEEIGYEDFFFSDGLTVIEWPSRIEELIPEEAVRVRIEKDPRMGFDFRRITVS